MNNENLITKKMELIFFVNVSKIKVFVFKFSYLSNRLNNKFKLFSSKATLCFTLFAYLSVSLSVTLWRKHDFFSFY